MNKLILGAFCGCSFSLQIAYVDLGDTYATSCQRYGGAGSVDEKYRTIEWNTRAYWITEQFLRKQCVCISYVRQDGQAAFSERELEGLLSKNALPTHRWREFPDIGGRSFVTNDDKIYARSWIAERRQLLQIAYKTWFERHHRFRNKFPSQPPVEEEPHPARPPAQPPVEEQA